MKIAQQEEFQILWANLYLLQRWHLFTCLRLISGSSQTKDIMYVVTLGAGVSVLFLTVTVSIHKPISSRFDRGVSLQYRKFLQKVCEMYGEGAQGFSYLTFTISCLLLPNEKCGRIHHRAPEVLLWPLLWKRFDSWMTGWAANMGCPGQSNCAHVALVPTKVSMSLGPPAS